MSETQSPVSPKRRKSDVMAESKSFSTAFEKGVAMSLDDDSMAVEGVPHGIITLNVGGTRFQTHSDTLKFYPRSYFGVWFSGSFRIQSESDGTYFIDRNPSSFGSILDFMRNNHVVLSDDVHDLKSLLLEAEFFRLEGLVVAIKAKIRRRERTIKYDMFACGTCRNVIGNLNEAVEICGRRFHTYQNPQDIRFNLLTIPKLHANVNGAPTTQGTWFPGYTWQFANCETCDTHLGWFFAKSVVVPPEAPEDDDSSKDDPVVVSGQESLPLLSSSESVQAPGADDQPSNFWGVILRAIAF